MPIVCLSGWKRSGKDSLATYLIERYGAEQLSFAGPLKDDCALDFKVPREAFDLQELKELPLLQYPVNPRDEFSAKIAEFMIKEFRTESGRKILGWDKNGEKWLALAEGDRGELIKTVAYHTPRSLAILRGSSNRAVDCDFWIKKAFDVAEDILKKNPDKMIVVTDLRYKSEADGVKNRFKDRNLIIRIDRFDTQDSTDPSETDLNDYYFQHRILNKTTLENAYQQLRNILEIYGYGH